MQGTRAYLEIVADYIDIFLSSYLNFTERVVLVAKVTFFLKLWRLWIHQHPSYSLKQNFISKEAYTDIQLSCHFVVLLIKMFRDFYPSLKCPLHLTGTYAAEIYFSKIGGMIGQERAFDFGDLLHSIGSLNKIAMHECSVDGLTFSRAHKKQEHIWKCLNKQEGSLEADLGDYEAVSSYEKIVDALKEGLQKAQNLCEPLGLKPANKGESLKWWSQPWVDTESIWSKLDADMGEADDYDDFQQPTKDDQQLQGDPDENDEVIAVSEIRHEIDGILDEANDSKTITTRQKINPTVEVDGKYIFKSTLVSQLNGNSTLSKDRLTRVRQGVYFSHESKQQSSSNANFFGIGSDCVVYFVDDTQGQASTKHLKRNGKPTSLNQMDVSQGTWYLGRVQKMRMKVGGRYVDYKRSFDLSNRPQGIEVQLGWYQRIKGSRMFTYVLTDLNMVAVESIIALANLTYNVSSEKYHLDESDYKIFNDFVKHVE